MSDARDFAPQLALARQYAALSGPFDAKDALRAGMGPDPSVEAAVMVASRLADVCDTHAGADGSKWLMRGNERRWDLDALPSGGRLAEVIAWRSQQTPFDDAARDIASALGGADLFAPDALERTLAATKDDSSGSPRAMLERLARALEWAGPAAPGYGLLAPFRAALARLYDRRRSEKVLEQEFQGREEHRAALAAWIARAAATTPVAALFVTGIAGVGKSALLELAVRDATAAGRSFLAVRLDFDRSVLDVLDSVGLTLETARQIADQLPEAAHDIRELRLKASGARDQDVKGRGRDAMPLELARALGRLVASSGRPVLMVLDTIDVLRGRGETHPRRLFEWLDRLVTLGLAPMTVIAAGRGDAADALEGRVGERLDLSGLEPDRAERVLDLVGVPATARAEIHAFAKDDPLLLRLAGTVAVAKAGITTLKPRRSRRETAAGPAARLFRILLSRIADPDLRKLADPGLLARRIDPELIREALAPALGLIRVGEKRARRLFEELEALDWLIERDPLAKGWLRLRADMRAVLAPLFYASKPALSAKIDRAASAWFARRGEPWAKIDGLYHELQSTRRGGAVPVMSRDAALGFSDAMLAELPQSARDAVLCARGELSQAARGAAAKEAAAGGPVDPRFVADLQLVVERGDWDEAADLHDHVFASASLEPAAAAGDAVRTFLWRVGRWRLAEQSLREMDATSPGDGDLGGLRPYDAMARLEMRAEFGFAPFVERLKADDAWRGLVRKIAARGAKTDMSAGALGFALLAAGAPIEDAGRRADPTRAAEQLWGAGGATLDAALAVARERMSRLAPRLAEPPRTQGAFAETGAFAKAITARRLAALSPHAGPIALLARLYRRARLAAHARFVLDALARSASWWNGGVDGASLAQGGDARDLVETFADLGLLAEWAGAAAFVTRDDDLALMATGAEAWRRTVAGQWAYGLAPRSWSGARHAGDLDVSTWARVHELLGAPDPAAASRAMLAAWSGAEAPGDRPPDEILARLAGFTEHGAAAIRGAEQPDRPFVAAGALLRAGAPAAFAPALATLVSLQQSP